MMRFLRHRREPQTLPSRRAYAQWAAAYPPVPHNPLMEIEQAAMLAGLPDLRDKTILDLACGSGRYGRLAAEQGARRVIGVDDSIPMLRAGQKAGVVVEWVCGDVSTVPILDDSVDVVICGLAIGHIRHVERPITEAARLLVAGGVALFSDFHPALFADGGRRTFVGEDGRTYAVEHHPHAIETIGEVGKSVGLHLEATAEPQITIGGVIKPAVVVYRFRLIA